MFFAGDKDKVEGTRNAVSQEGQLQCKMQFYLLYYLIYDLICKL